MVRTAKGTPKTFSYYAPKAKKVSLAGSFNNWDAKATVAKKDSKGNWVAKVPLSPGSYEYKFVVDGVWVTDPCATNAAYNSFGTQNSLIQVK